MTDQEIFDVVVRGMLTTKKRATTNSNGHQVPCYMDENGHRCGLAYLIPPDIAIPNIINELPITDLSVKNFFLNKCKIHHSQLYLLLDLQLVHDRTKEVAWWEVEFQYIAKHYKLTMPSIEEKVCQTNQMAIPAHKQPISAR